ncbi:uncharacterized protein LOC130436601 isoform X1 [Triplophysa dalaica]|uniref:uncharacterized protein LOC130436601 isoform X1 n=1 Tax=Triplophysa dalaica TaxID=1582913 RepID=UPI0024DFDCA6|nr:uncharacterized protein LOC130436601 isoform X1 [Triplophysa dalaica]
MDELFGTNHSDVVGRLAFKYMEMCKVDSSSDSESETNPRWSDLSNKGLENWAACTKLRRLSGQNYQQCLDPYDGSSEDSSNSWNKGPKRQRHSGLRVKGRGRRSAINALCPRREPTQNELTDVCHHGDVQMRSSSDTEPSFCSPCRPVTRLKVDLSDSGFNTRSSLNSPALPSGTDTVERSSERVQLGSSASRSPDCSSFHAAFSKRKFFPPSGDTDEGMQRKRPCISDMEVERE